MKSFTCLGRLCCIVFILSACALPAHAASAKTYYISPDGSDRNTGTSSGHPWASPSHALNCGDVIVAAPGNYSAANFYSGKWGAVTCSASQPNVAWLICGKFDACKISAATTQGMWVDQSYWGVQGWEVTAPVSNADGTCFRVEPSRNHPVTIHHIIFANNVANGCTQGGFESTPNIPSLTGVDYLAILGNIAYDTASGSQSCTSGISIWEPVQSDSKPGTHIYIAGNFSYGNLNPIKCAGTPPTDGEGIIFDTFDGTQTSGLPVYTAQAVAYNNLVANNGGKGIEVFNNAAGNKHATIWIDRNTIWGDLTDPNQAWGGCGELAFATASDIDAYGNLISTKSATGCTGKPIYAMAVSSGDATDKIADNWAYGYDGNNTFVYSSGSFAYGANTLGIDPAFRNPVAPSAPDCSGAANVLACMSQAGNNVIANFTPTAPGAAAYGRRTPGAASVVDPLYPAWLCTVTNLPGGLVTPGCSKAPK